jgi:hypothetical protein
MTPMAYGIMFPSLAIAIVLTVWIISRHLGAGRQAAAAITAGQNYRDLATEYQRLTDMAVTAQEHTDLRLTDISVRLDELRDQVDGMQRILKDVE